MRLVLNRKDKVYRRYASGIERALSLFDTALQEWADYISFLGRLHKVRVQFQHLMRYKISDMGFVRPSKQNPLSSTIFRTKRLLQSAWHNA